MQRKSTICSKIFKDKHVWLILKITFSIINLPRNYCELGLVSTVGSTMGFALEEKEPVGPKCLGSKWDETGIGPNVNSQLRIHLKFSLRIAIQKPGQFLR